MINNRIYRKGTSLISLSPSPNEQRRFSPRNGTHLYWDYKRWSVKSPVELEKEKGLGIVDACEAEQLPLAADGGPQCTDMGGSCPGRNACNVHRNGGASHHMRNMEHEVEDTVYKILETG